MTKRVRIRSFIIGGLFTLFFVSLIVKLYFLQVVDASWLLDKAEQSWQTSEVLQPKRGAILDRNGKVLAQDVPAYTVALNPEIINKENNVEAVVDGLAKYLDMDTADGRQKLLSLATKKRDDGSFQPQVEVRNEGWKIDSDVAGEIKAWRDKNDIGGLYLLDRQKRYYPGNSLASHVLGYTNKEGEAVNGIEREYDQLLQGTPGSISYEKDRNGNPLPNARIVYKPPVDGKTIELTIDQNIQHLTEEALRKSYDEYKPASAMAVVVDPKTLEVLSLASFPDFNPNNYWEIDSEADFIDHPVTSEYEPGSTFKIVTLAGAVDQGIFHPDDTYQSGSIQVPGTTIRDHNGVGWGKITYMEGLKRSSNVAFVKLGYEGLGEQKLRDYIERFGFGVKTGIDLPGETPGIIGFHWPSEVATATFGQGKVTVSAIQEIAAISAIANGGNLLQPHVLKKVIDPSNDQVLQNVQPTTVRRVLPEDTARKVAGYLEQVVSDQQIGTGRGAYLKDYSVAGKTGTSQKVIDGKYSDSRYIISFISFAPVEDPRIAVCVIVDDPDLGGDYTRGGEVAAPVIKEIMYNTLRYMGVPSRVQNGDAVRIQQEDSAVAAPNVVNDALPAAYDQLRQKGIAYEVLGDGQHVVGQFPQAGSQMASGQRMLLLADAPEHVPLPDLTGKSVRDALEICSLLDMRCQVTGEGYVAGQTVSAASGQRQATLQLKPWNELPSGSQEDDGDGAAGAAEGKENQASS